MPFTLIIPIWEIHSYSLGRGKLYVCERERICLCVCVEGRLVLTLKSCVRMSFCLCWVIQM